MKVLLDLSLLGRGFAAQPTRTGIFRATEGLTRSLLEHPGIRLAVAAQDSWVSEIQLLTYCRERARDLEHRIVRLWEQPNASDEEGQDLIAGILAAELEGRNARWDRATLMLLNATARRRPLPDRFDVLHSLSTVLPDDARLPTRARVLTLHDLIPLVHPEWSYDGAEAQYRAITASIGPRDFVIASSEATARDIRTHLGISAERLFVTPLAAAYGVFYPEQAADRLAQVRSCYGIPAGRYLLSLCTLEPRKNLSHLVGCFFRFLDEARLADLYLVLAGPTGWKNEALFDSVAGRPELRSRIILTGYVPDSDLAALYSGAAAFVCPSLVEGFGLPVLEAMQCGTPVITSNTSSLPEVTGAAAICVPPTDADALCEALGAVLADSGLAGELRRRGLERASMYSWSRTAELTVQAYRRMLELSGAQAS